MREAGVCEYPQPRNDLRPDVIVVRPICNRRKPLRVSTTLQYSQSEKARKGRRIGGGGVEEGMGHTFGHLAREHVGNEARPAHGCPVCTCSLSPLPATRSSRGLPRKKWKWTNGKLKAKERNKRRFCATPFLPSESGGGGSTGANASQPDGRRSVLALRPDDNPHSEVTAWN